MDHSRRRDDYDHVPESEDEVERTEGDVRRLDHETITAEEEAERLLGSGRRASAGGLAKLFNPSGGSEKETRRVRRKDRWRRDEGELLYKVEEGGRSSSEDSIASSRELDIQKVGNARGTRKAKTCCGWCRCISVLVVTILVFLVLLYAAYRASHSTKKTPYVAKTLSNGTHEFAPTTILLSLDGFRADFIHRGLTPALSAFIKQGVSPKYMLPSFPSLTFPNHFTLATGMYPESHGIVGNTFWDPILEKEFWYTDPEKSMQPEFWNAEPIWETAELQGARAAIHMWPGSEAHIGGKELEPAYIDKFNAEELLSVKVDRILEWLDIPGPNDPGASEATPRPQLIAAYVPNVDSDGHKYGPNSTYIRSTIAEVDGMLASLFKGIDDRNLTNIINIIIVSDHGMATTSNTRLIHLESLLDRTLIEHTDGWPLYGLRPKNQSTAHLEALYTSLLQKSTSPDHASHFSVYLRDRTMPPRYHFSRNPRIAPLWLVPAPGWAIITQEESPLPGTAFAPKGLHGYDHEHPLMRALFAARGPAFAMLAPGSLLAPFQNVEVYNLVCDSLGLVPQGNNGTMRLPLQTAGLHDFGVGGEEEEDFDEEDLGAVLLPPDLPGVAGLPPVQSSDPVVEPVVEDGGEEEEEHGKTWLEWVNEKIENVKGWAAGIFGGSGEDSKAADEGN